MFHVKKQLQKWQSRTVYWKFKAPLVAWLSIILKMEILSGKNLSVPFSSQLFLFFGYIFLFINLIMFINVYIYSSFPSTCPSSCPNIGEPLIQEVLQKLDKLTMLPKMKLWQPVLNIYPFMQLLYTFDIGYYANFYSINTYLLKIVCTFS